MNYNNNTHISICAIIKNEHEYLKEWIDYHLNIGFDSIFLYEDIDSMSHYNIIKNYSNVHLYKLETLLNNQFFKIYKDRQLALYYLFLYQKRKNIDWCAFIDVDEFIFTENQNIHNILANLPTHIGGLCIYWENYGANGHINKPTGSVMSNYTKPCKILEKDKNTCFKSIVNLKNSYYFKNKHLIENCIDINDNIIGNSNIHPIYHTIWIKHYITKSLEEYKSKLNRGNITKNFRTMSDFYEMNDDLYKCNQLNEHITYNFRNKKKFITLCTIAKNENKYIKEFVDYHLNIGIDHIIIYDNNDITLPCIQYIFEDEKYKKCIDIIDVRGLHISYDEKTYINKPYSFHGIQEICYTHCYNNFKNFSDWFIFIDVDEFLTLNNISLYDYLNNDIFKDIDVIQLNWVIYGDNNLLRYDNRPVLERFITPAHQQTYNHVKSIVRGKRDIEHIDCHIAYSPDFKYVNNIGEPVKCSYKQERNVDICYIRHFFTKTIEEFIERKYNYTSATGKDYLNTLNNRINEFFKINTDTPEKREIINDVVNKKDNELKYIISFTSYGDRLKKLVPIMIESLKKQKYKHFKIVLTIYKDDIKYIPQSICNDVELIISDIDLKPHLKYFYTTQKYKNYPIITVDDDIEYDDNMTYLLYHSWLQNQKCISCLRAHKIITENDGTPIEYKKWNWEVPVYEGPSDYLFATGVGGIIYPPNCLNIHENDIQDINNCLYADDIYLKHKELKNNIKIICLGKPKLNNIKYEFDKKSLSIENVNNCRNDQYIKQLNICLT